METQPIVLNHKSPVSSISFNTNARHSYAYGLSVLFILFISLISIKTASAAFTIGVAGTITAQQAQQQQAQLQAQQQSQTSNAISQLIVILSTSTDVETVAISPDNKRIASGGSDNKLTVWDASGQALVKALTIPLQGKGNRLYDLAFSPDGKRIVTGSSYYSPHKNESTVHIWNAYTGAESVILQSAPTVHCGQVAFDPQGLYVAAGCYTQATDSSTLYIWDAKSGGLIQSFHGTSGPIGFSPDGTRIFSGDNKQLTIKIWQLGSANALLQLQGQNVGAFYSAVYSVDGLTLGTGNGNGTITLWNAQTGQEILNFQAHSKPVTDIAVSPDGTRFASTSEDGTLVLWDGSSIQRLSTFQSSQPLRSLSFSSSSQALLVGGYDNTLRIFADASAVANAQQQIQPANQLTQQQLQLSQQQHQLAQQQMLPANQLTQRQLQLLQQLLLAQQQKQQGIQLTAQQTQLVQQQQQQLKQLMTPQLQQLMQQLQNLTPQQMVQQLQQLIQQQTQQQTQQLAQQQAQQVAQQQAQQQAQYPVTTSTRAYLLYNDTSSKIFFDTFDPTRGTWMPTSLGPRMQVEIVAMTSGSGGLQVRVETQGKGSNQYGMEVGGSYRLYANPQTNKWDVITIQAPKTAAVAAAQQQQAQQQAKYPVTTSTRAYPHAS